MIDKIKSRKSIRKFTGEEVKEEDLKQIFESANTAPSCFNGQQVSLVYTRDKQKIHKIAELCGGQEQVRTCSVFILLVIDFYRAKKLLEHHNLEITENDQFLKQTGLFDAGIVATLLNLSAMNFGYGCTMIGGVHNNSKEIGKLFNLPEKTFVALGLTMGVPHEQAQKSPVKPKIDIKAFAMEDIYDVQLQERAFLEYEKVLDKWFEELKVEQPLFSEVIKKHFSKK